MNIFHVEHSTTKLTPWKLLREVNGRFLIKDWEQWRLGEEGKTSEGNKFLILEVLQTK